MRPVRPSPIEGFLKVSKRASLHLFSKFVKGASRGEDEPSALSGQTCYSPVVPAFAEHPQSRGEEIANSISHGLGVIAILVGAPFLIIHAASTDSAWNIVGASIFLASAVVLYLGSTLYHAIPHAGARQVFHVLDHSGIFFLIAGTYTPFTLGILRGPLGFTMFGVIWALASIGIVLKGLRVMRSRRWSNIFYLGLGWMVLILAKPLWDQAGPVLFLWLFGGGIFYSFGLFFYNAKQLKFSHFLWHLCVLAGTALHYIAVYQFAFR